MGRSSAGTDAFAMGRTDEQPEHTATLAALRLDVTEVTVERFRAFVAQYDTSKPVAGAGPHPGIANSGWKAAWNVELPETDDVLKIELKCSNRATWSDEPVTGNEQKPINCVSWYVAFAFCAWDRGFLPSEAEWEFAAAGGSENRLYPWGSAAPDRMRASYDCRFDNDPVCNYTDIPLVRSTTGVGRYGHYELGGSLKEWVLDAYGPNFYAGGACNNCANLTTDSPRVTRGGGWQSPPEDLRSAARGSQAAGENAEDVGFRCARTP
jgi:formylglycine-generating enzyme